jgi:hypothetical protein
LGKIYTPDLLEAFSSDVNRTKASLQLVLAGLFPPVEEQIWETGLNWQPIPFSTLPLDQDPVRDVIFIDRFPIKCDFRFFGVQRAPIFRNFIQN